jgi:hypothetical protein
MVANLVCVHELCLSFAVTEKWGQFVGSPTFVSHTHWTVLALLPCMRGSPIGIYRHLLGSIIETLASESCYINWQIYLHKTYIWIDLWDIPIYRNRNRLTPLHKNDTINWWLFWLLFGLERCARTRSLTLSVSGVLVSTSCTAIVMFLELSW